MKLVNRKEKTKQKKLCARLNPEEKIIGKSEAKREQGRIDGLVDKAWWEKRAFRLYFPIRKIFSKNPV